MEEGKCLCYLQDHQKGGSGKLQGSQPHLSPLGSGGMNNPGNESKCMKDKKVIGCSQHGFKKGISCSANLVGFSDDIMGLLNEGRAVVVAYLDFREAVGTVSHYVLR